MSMKEEFKKIRSLAALPLKSEREMRQVELVTFLYNEHEFFAEEVAPKLIKHARYPFKLSIVDNTAQISPINFSRIWNKHIKETKCEFIAFMDSDIYVGPDWLKRMMESFEDPSVDIVVPVFDNTSANQQRAMREATYPSTEPLKSILAAQLVIYRVASFKKIGLFDERFLLYGQDSEWGHRFLKKGGKGVIRRDVFVRHIGSYSLNKFAEEKKSLYNSSIEREYARTLFKYLTK